jgi:hypothetical protein
MPCAAPSAPVMKVLAPLITQWLPSCTAVVFIIDGSEPAPPSGSVIRKAVRISPAASGRSTSSFWAVLPIFSIRHMLPSSGAIRFRAIGPSRE